MKDRLMNESGRLLMVVFVCLCFLCATALSQEITGNIVGTVRDTTGAVVPGATVTITNTDKQSIARTVTTDDEGRYAAPLLPAGNYEVAIESPNFKRFVSKLKLNVNDRQTIDANLEAGQVSETVTITSDPVQVQLQSPQASTLISGTQVRELSLNNRNFVQLTTLSPGVSSGLSDQVYVGTTNPSGQANTVNISVNGARPSANNWTVDGADNTDAGSNLTILTYPSVDAIGEFQILRSLYPAEQGRSGGGQVNVVTKSGTNEFHGNFYEFLRNNVLNANNFLLNRNGSPSNLDANGKAKRPPLRYNNFGYTIGGPVYLPRFGEGGPAYYSGKNKTFFFFSQEFRRVVTNSVFTPLAPTAALKRGIFPSPVCVLVAADGSCAQQTTQITNINPVAQAYINEIYGPLPEPSSDFVLTSAQRNVFNFRQELVRIDHTFTSKLSAFYRFENDTIPTQEPNALFSNGSGLPGISNTSTNSPGRSHVARVTYALSPTTILDGGYAHSYGAILSTPSGKLLIANSPTINIPLAFTNTLGRVPTVAPGFASTSTFGPYDNFSTYDKVNINLSKIFGAHSTKYGAALFRFRKHENAGGGNQGTFAFSSGSTTSRPAGTSATLQSWANFLLGNVSSFTQSKLDITADLIAQNNEFYAQDEWRLRPNLTLYYGVRYSSFRQPYDRNGLLTNFDPATYSAARAYGVDPTTGNRVGNGDPLNGIVVQGVNSPYGKKVSNEDNKNFAPRIGLAYDPFKKGTTSIRMGYGIYYDSSLYGTYEQNEFANPPFNDSISISNTRLENPGAGSASVSAAPRSLRGVALPFQTPYLQQWSFDVQQQLMKNTLLDVGYYGSKGTHLQGIVDINLLPPGLAFQAGILPAGQHFTNANEPTLDRLRPYKGYRAVPVIENAFDSNYHSLQVAFKRSFAGGSEVNAAYTFSKNLTNAQTDRSSAPQNSYNFAAEYGRALLDRRHIFTLNYVYELPFYRTQEGTLGHLLGGFEFSGITSIFSGLPFTVTTSNGEDPAGIGFLVAASPAGPRPNLVGDANNGPKTFDQFFNTAAFQNVPIGSNAVGNAGRGIVNGPGTIRFDISLLRNIKIGERARVQFRAEAFNIFNHTNFSNINTSLGNSLFGRVTDVRDPRTLQFGLKLYY